MTMKQKIQVVIQSLPEETTIDQAIEGLCLLAAVEEGLEQLDQGEGIPDDDIDWEDLRARKK